MFLVLVMHGANMKFNLQFLNFSLSMLYYVFNIEIHYLLWAFIYILKIPKIARAVNLTAL